MIYYVYRVLPTFPSSTRTRLFVLVADEFHRPQQCLAYSGGSINICEMKER